MIGEVSRTRETKLRFSRLYNRGRVLQSQGTRLRPLLERRITLSATFQDPLDPELAIEVGIGSEPALLEYH
jgi:hypothetical protein